MRTAPIVRLLRRMPEPVPGDCWEWTGCVDKDGYGRLREGRTHRLMFEAVNGPVPAGLVLDHLCRNPRCCNPAHLEAVTQRENVLRGLGPSAMCAARTRCPRGHEYDTVAADGRRRCSICDRKREREAYRRRKASRQPVTDGAEA